MSATSFGMAEADAIQLERYGIGGLVRIKNATIKAHQSVLAERDKEIADLRAALAAATAQQPVAGGADLRATVRGLDSIGMRLGADLTQMPTVTVNGTDCLSREEVMGRLMAWRREWDANSKARPDPRAVQPVAGDERAAFEAWAKAEGLIQESFGIRSTSSMCGVAEKAFQAGHAHSARQIATLHAVIADLTAERGGTKFDEVLALELAHDCGVRFKDDMPITSVEDTLIEYAHAILRNFAPQPMAPAGWQWVPKEPTIEMIAALAWGGDEILAIGQAAITDGVYDGYASMLAAAPAAPTGSRE